MFILACAFDSKEMKIVYLDHQEKSITGGHKYNDAFLAYLQKLSSEEIAKTPSCAALYPGWKKLISPFKELSRLGLMKSGSLVFWGDTTYKYHLLLALFAKIFKKIHSSIIIHHFSFLGEKGIKRYVTRMTLKLYISMFNDIIVPSPFTYDVAKNLFPQKKIYYIPLPFEHSFNVSNEYEKGNLLYVGTVEERKGLKYLIEALRIIISEHPKFDFRLNIVGKITDESYYRDLLSMISEIGIQEKVHFLGRVSNEQLQECYRRAEIFTFPSLLEGYGIVLVEAMSKGLPIVAFNNSAMPYTIKDGENGLLTENKNSFSYAERIMSIVGNEELRKRLQGRMEITVKNLKTKMDFEAGIRDFYYEIGG